MDPHVEVRASTHPARDRKIGTTLHSNGYTGIIKGWCTYPGSDVNWLVAWNKGAGESWITEYQRKNLKP